MSQRRPARPRRRSPLVVRPSNRRRRLVTVTAAGIALVAVAALIGGSTDTSGTGHRSDRQTSAQGDAALPTSAPGGAGSPAAEGTSDGEASTTLAPSAAPSDGDASEQRSGDADAASPTAGRDDVAFLAGAPTDAKIIRTGSLQVEVAKGKFAEGTAGLTRIATGLGGFVSASEITSFEDHPGGTITLRIPADQFDKAVAEVGKLGAVQALTTGSQDVTGEYTDVASRLQALIAERDQISLVLSRAESIPDILSVRDRLAAVQGEIEVAQGRQKVLDDQTSLSTLTVQVSEKGAPVSDVAPAAERSGLSRLWHDSTDRFGDGGRSIALGLATMAPWLLLGLVLWLPGRWLWRRLAPVEGTEPSPPATVAN